MNSLLTAVCAATIILATTPHAGAVGGDDDRGRQPLVVQERGGSGFHGHGVLVWSDDARYEGEWRDGKFNGRGIYVWDTGRRYEGEYRDGKAHGQGIYTERTGYRYEGAHRAGKAHGRGGVATFADGARYEGEWRAGCFEEEGGRRAFIGTTAAACDFE